MPQMADMQDRTALITGSGTGLGRSLAIKLAERGADVIINYSRSAGDAKETAEQCREFGVEVQVVKADVSEKTGCQALAKAAFAWGKLDILINNAGITRHASKHSDLDALSKDDFMDTYAVNVVGPFLMMQACKPLLVSSYEESGRASSVLNTSSIAGVAGIGSSVAYAASKGALNTMTFSLARALAPQIRVNSVCPGFIGTRWFRERMDEEKFKKVEARVRETTPLQVASGPDDIADAALFFVSDAARHVTGELLIVDGGRHLGFGR